MSLRVTFSLLCHAHREYRDVDRSVDQASRVRLLSGRRVYLQAATGMKAILTRTWYLWHNLVAAPSPLFAGLLCVPNPQ